MQCYMKNHVCNDCVSSFFNDPHTKEVFLQGTVQWIEGSSESNLLHALNVLPTKAVSQSSLKTKKRVANLTDTTKRINPKDCTYFECALNSTAGKKPCYGCSKRDDSGNQYVIPVILVKLFSLTFFMYELETTFQNHAG